jgi:hypothetical protein
LHRDRVAPKIPGVLELEVYAAGVRDLNKILELDHEIEAVPGLRYKVDRNHDGAIPPKLRPKTKMQLLEA